MKRLVCFLALLVCFSWSALAVPKVDGKFGPLEYNETLATLQIPQHESNNNLTFAYLHWVASPADQSVYLSLQYKCSDYAIEDGRTGVMVYINDDPVGTLFADSSTEGVDHGRFELVGFLDDGALIQPHESFCELRVGIKFWPEDEIFVGVQILDFSGNPSNYYRQLVYSPYTTTTLPSKTETSHRTTTEKSTTVNTTTQASTTAAETTARTTAPVITASPSREATATTAAAATSVVQPTVLQPAFVPKETKAQSGTTKVKTTRAKATKANTTEPSATETTTAGTTAAVLSATTEASASETAAETVSSAQMYREMNKVKIVGTVLVAVILTAAIMSSVFLGMRQKQGQKETHTPQEEYDDFG